MSDTSIPRVHYVRENGSVVEVGDLTAKILNTKVLDDNNPNDTDIAAANQAMQRIFEEGLSDTLEGLVLIDPKAASVLTALVYTGMKLKSAEHRNSLTLKEVNEEE